MRLLSIQVGMPQTLGNGVSTNKMFGRWSTGIFKHAVSGPVQLRTLNLDGDAQADLSVHGGPDKAVYAYPAAHYPLWREELGIPEMDAGGFGENLTIDGADEQSVCIGDQHAIGTALLEVCQPRTPCWKLARKWNLPDLPARLVKSGRSGWYYRVLREGTVQAGTEIKLAERKFPQWTIQMANVLAYNASVNVEQASALAECPALAEEWRNGILYRLGRATAT
jgi:MOSC domain-containing protein YiiM